MLHKCPQCGSTIDGERFGAELLTLRFTPQEMIVVKALVQAKGFEVDTERLLALMADGVNRPRAKALIRLRQTVHFVRAKIVLTEYGVEKMGYGGGYRLHRRSASARLGVEVPIEYRVISVR